MTTLLAGFLVWGGIGLALDRWLDTRIFAPVGLIVGMCLGIYAVVARFGLFSGPARSAEPSARARPERQPAAVPAGSGREMECR